MNYQKNPEKDLGYYHDKFAEITILIEQNKWSELKKEEAKIKQLIKQYKEDFQNNPNYINNYVVTIESILENLK